MHNIWRHHRRFRKQSTCVRTGLAPLSFLLDHKLWQPFEMMQSSDEQNAHFTSVVWYLHLSRPSGKMYCVNSARTELSVLVVINLISGKETLSPTPHSYQIHRMFRCSAVCTNRCGWADPRYHSLALLFVFCLLEMIQISIGYVTCPWFFSDESRERTSKSMFSCVSQPGAGDCTVDWKLRADGMWQEQSNCFSIVRAVTLAIVVSKQIHLQGGNIPRITCIVFVVEHKVVELYPPPSSWPRHKLVSRLCSTVVNIGWCFVVRSSHLLLVHCALRSLSLQCFVSGPYPTVADSSLRGNRFQESKCKRILVIYTYLMSESPYKCVRVYVWMMLCVLHVCVCMGMWQTAMQINGQTTRQSNSQQGNDTTVDADLN